LQDFADARVGVPGLEEDPVALDVVAEDGHKRCEENVRVVLVFGENGFKICRKSLWLSD
jgi:hypothetical protein